MEFTYTLSALCYALRPIDYYASEKNERNAFIITANEIILSCFVKKWNGKMNVDDWWALQEYGETKRIHSGSKANAVEVVEGSPCILRPTSNAMKMWNTFLDNFCRSANWLLAIWWNVSFEESLIDHQLRKHYSCLSDYWQIWRANAI